MTMTMTESEIKLSPAFAALKESLGALGGTLSEEALVAIAKKTLSAINGTNGSGRKKSAQKKAEERQEARQKAYDARKASERRTKLETTGDKITKYLLPEIFDCLLNFVEEHGEIPGPKINLTLGKSDGQASFSVQVINYPSKPQTYTKGQILEAMEKFYDSDSEGEEIPG